MTKRKQLTASIVGCAKILDTMQCESAVIESDMASMLGHMGKMIMELSSLIQEDKAAASMIVKPSATATVKKVKND